MKNKNDDEYEEDGGVGCLGNYVYFYSPVNTLANMELNKILVELDNQIQEVDEKGTVIHLHIKSGGGDVFSAFSTVDTISRLKTKVHTHIDGFAASAATIMSCAGKHRTIGKHGFSMIHQCSNSFEGKFSEIQDNLENVKCIMDTIKHFYKKHTKIPSKKLEEILKRDRYMTAEETLKYGIVDEIF